MPAYGAAAISESTPYEIQVRLGRLTLRHGARDARHLARRFTRWHSNATSRRAGRGSWLVI